MRSSGGVRRHAGKAAAADSIAAPASAAVVKGVCPMVSPVAGLTTSRHSVDCDSTQPPSIKFKTLARIAVASLITILDSGIADKSLSMSLCDLNSVCINTHAGDIHQL